MEIASPPKTKSGGSHSVPFGERHCGKLIIYRPLVRRIEDAKRARMEVNGFITDARMAQRVELIRFSRTEAGIYPAETGRETL
jgi:hypothetical protein